MCDTSNIIRSTAYARGTVWWVTLQIDPMCDTLQRFKRPCLIISNDEFNMKFGKVTIITSPRSNNNIFPIIILLF